MFSSEKINGILKMFAFKSIKLLLVLLNNKYKKYPERKQEITVAQAEPTIPYLGIKNII